MNAKIKASLISVRDILEAEIKELSEKLTTINGLLADENRIYRPKTATGLERRRGGVKHVIDAVAAIGEGNIRQITHKVSELHPVVDEVNLLSKVSTYLKRLHVDGELNCVKKGKVKVYSLTAKSA